MSSATKAKPKKTSAPKSAAPTGPRSIEQLRADVAAGEKAVEKLGYSWNDKAREKERQAKEKLAADRAELATAEQLAEIAAAGTPAAVETDFVERSIALSTIVITGNHREQADAAAQERLAVSLASHKLQQRIGVRAMGDGRFELIFGSRRLGAAKQLGWAEIPAKVYDSSLTPAQVEILRSIENFGRKNLSAVEEAVAVARVIEAIEKTLEPLKRRWAAGGGIRVEGDALDAWKEIAASFDFAKWAKDQPELAAAVELNRQINAAGGLEAYVGQQFSRPAKWVKDHAYVSQLGGRTRELLMAGRLDIGAARELAKLGDKDRADDIARQGARTEDLRGGEPVSWFANRVRDAMKSLKVVPWRLDVAFGRDVPGCTGHACVTCPFNSRADPDLFGGSIADEPEAGICTHPTCFAAKQKIVDAAMAKAAKQAEPTVKKAAVAAGRAGNGDASVVGLATVGRFIPGMVKQSSALRKLQKALEPVVEAAKPKAKPEPAASSKPVRRTPEEIAAEKLDKARQQWAEQVEELLFKAVFEDQRAYRAVALLLLDATDVGKRLDEVYWKPAAEEFVRNLVAELADHLDAAIHCSGPDIGIVAKRLLEKDCLKDALHIIGQVDSVKAAPLYAKLAAGWGAPVPPEPKLEDFLPKPKTAKATHNGANHADESGEVLHVRRGDDGDGVAGVESGGDRPAVGDAAHGAGAQADGQQNGGAGPGEAGTSGHQGRRVAAGSGRPVPKPDDDAYTADELGVSYDTLKRVLSPGAPSPSKPTKKKAAEPGRLPVIMVQGWPYWCDAWCYPGKGPETAHLRPLFSEEEWGNRPKAVDWSELSWQDLGYCTGLIVRDANGTRYVVGPAEQMLRVQFPEADDESIADGVPHNEPCPIEKIVGTLTRAELEAAMAAVRLWPSGPDAECPVEPRVGRPITIDGREYVVVTAQHHNPGGVSVVDYVLQPLRDGGAVEFTSFAYLQKKFPRAAVEDIDLQGLAVKEPRDFEYVLGPNKWRLIIRVPADAATGDAGDGFAEDEPAALTPRDIGVTAAELEKLDAVDAIIRKSTPIATVKSLAHAGRRYVVLGTAPHRGHECWRLAPLGTYTPLSLGHTSATAAAERGEFHDIGVIDAADKKQKRAIVCNPPGVEPAVLYVRPSNAPAAGEQA